MSQEANNRLKAVLAEQGEANKQTKAFARDEFSELLFKCHSIIRNRDKLSPEVAFDEICKILLMKIRYERSNSENQIFSKSTFKNDKEGKDFHQFLFEQTKEDFKEDDLFEPTEMMRIREDSFEAIVEELQAYNLFAIPDDVKGGAFEQFLGKTFRGELGQFFTPRTIVDFMVDVLDPQEREVICDPCCGSGGFLIKTFEYVKAKIENEIHLAKEKIKLDGGGETYEKQSDKEKADIDETVRHLFSELNAELDLRNPKSRIRGLRDDCIFGADSNPRMSRTAKINMIMHGDGRGGIHHHNGLLNVNGIFENRFDIILTNPPFGSRVEKSLKITEADKYADIEKIKKYRKRYGSAYDEALKQVNDNIDKPLLDLYETGSISALTEVLFIERCLNLLKPGGRMGIVLSEETLSRPSLQKVRDFAERRAKILLITSIPPDVFTACGATVKHGLAFFKKFTEEEAEQWKSLAEKAEKDINKKYEPETKPIREKLELRGKEAPSKEEKKKLRATLKQIEEIMYFEIKTRIKKEFDYQIPIAEAEKAGISHIGFQIENELEPLAREFKTYRENNTLWSANVKEINRQIAEDEMGRARAGDGVVKTRSFLQ